MQELILPFCIAACTSTLLQVSNRYRRIPYCNPYSFSIPYPTLHTYPTLPYPTRTIGPSHPASRKDPSYGLVAGAVAFHILIRILPGDLPTTSRAATTSRAIPSSQPPRATGSILRVSNRCRRIPYSNPHSSREPPEPSHPSSHHLPGHRHHLPGHHHHHHGQLGRYAGQDDAPEPISAG